MENPNDIHIPQAIVSSPVAFRRLAIGLIQGLLLYLLFHAATEQTWPATQGTVFAPLLLTGLLVPPLLISGLGHLRARLVLGWVLLATALLAGLAVYDIGRETFAPFGLPFVKASTPLLPSAGLVFFSCVALFIAHSLVMAGGREGRIVASYPSYFETSWSLLVQLAFALLFVGVLWMILWLGAGLFLLVRLEFLSKLLVKSWFAIPVSTFAFACALHLTDVRPAIVRGIRTLLLMLLSWILPVTVLIAAAFLCSLPTTGLEPLWQTRHASFVLLGTTAVLVVLINAAFQNGAVGTGVARIVRWSARGGALLLLPLVLIAIHALMLRVGDHGWTGIRVLAAACLLVASVYALGYAWAALPFHKGGWLAPVAPVNVFNAVLVIGVIVALYSPLADPARLAVQSQMARLASGKVSVEKFDFDYLKFHGERYGRAALQELAQRQEGPDAARLRERAAQAMAKENPWVQGPPPQADEVAANLHAWPKGAQVPAAILRQDWSKGENAWAAPACLRSRHQSCDIYELNLSGENRRELLVIDEHPNGSPAVLAEAPDGSWSVAGRLKGEVANCAPVLQKMREGQFKLVAPRAKELDIDGNRLSFEAQPFKSTCPKAKPE